MSKGRWAAEGALFAAAVAIDLLVWGGDSPLRNGALLLPLWVVPTVTVAVYALLLMRWSHPGLVFGVQWVYALVGLLLPLYQPFVGLLVALHAVARRAVRRWSWLALLSCAVPFGIASYNAASEAHRPFAIGFGAAAAVWLALSLTVWGLGRLAYTADRRAERLRAAEAAQAVRAERLRLARELHDIVAHAVSLIILQAAGARTLPSSETEQVQRALKVIESAGVQAMGELRRLLGLLRAANPEDPGGNDLPPTLQDIDGLLALTRASAIDVERFGRPADRAGSQR